MATAKPKVKRMMLGGAAFGAVKKAVTSKAAPMKMQAAAKSAAQQAAPKQFMSNALRSGAMKPPSGMNAAPKQFMSDKQQAANLAKQAAAQKIGNLGTGSQAASAAAALRKLPMNPPRPGSAGPKPMQTLGAAGVPARGISRSDLKMAGLGAAGAARGMMKKGGAVKKATKK